MIAEGPEHCVLERSRNQDLGEFFAQPLGVELPPAIRADLLDPALWQDGLAKYASATNLAVAVTDTAGRLIGENINPRPTWSHFALQTPAYFLPFGRGGGVSLLLAPLSASTALPTPWPEAALSWRATERGSYMLPPSCPPSTGSLGCAQFGNKSQGTHTSSSRANVSAASA
jgi:hypothetical protein